MLKLNPNTVHSVELVTEDDKTHTLNITGVNDLGEFYAIYLGNLPNTEELQRVSSLAAQLMTMPDLTEAYKRACAKVMCDFVGNFFEPHYEEEQSATQIRL